jgi:hypothetical protein
VVADAGQFSDGEENLVPVLSNRMMVTETLPLPVNGKGSKDFTMDKLLSSSADKSKKNYRLTLEFASNPAWYAVQALPSLNERDYNDAYSVFGALYSNELGAWILNSDPKIRSVFESWKKLTPASLSSNLEKNQELKAVLLQQTPWVAEAASESDNKARLGLYFDPQALSANLNTNLEKLRRLQGPAGGFCWFEGMPASRGITQDIIAGIGRIGRMTGQQGKANDEHMGALRQVAGNAVSYIDREFTVNYREMLAKHKESVRDNLLYWTEIQYLYSRSFFLADVPPAGSLADPLNFYLTQSVKYWMQSSLPEQAMLAVALKRFGAGGSTQVKDKDKLLETASLIIRSLGERALHSHEFGMYWAVAETRFSRISDIGTQAALIEAFDEVAADQKSVEEMKMWLLKQKQTTTWETSRATTDACYALLMKGAGLLTTEPGVKISLGSLKVDPAKMTDLKTEAGTGYFKLNWSGKEINPEMGKVKVTKSTPGVAWGALYWQYFEDLDKITPAVSPLKLEKKLFLSKNTPSGPVIEQLGEGASLKVGDKLTVRVVLKVDRDLSFVHLRDMRASAFEPVLQFVSSPGSTPSSSGNNLSGYRYQDGLGYYQTMTDASADFFFDYVPKGTYVFEYSLVVNAAGEYSNGITSVQCMYAPEFAAHSEGIRVSIVR